SKMGPRTSVSFAGCGFLGIYHVGVAVCLRQHAPQLLLERIGGASAGALTACCLLCELPLETMAGDFLRIVQETRRHSLGAFSPWFNLPDCLLEGMQRRLPDDAHERVNGRLHISLTRVSDRRNVVMSEFSSRYELLQALLCSCFIPGLSGLLPPKVRGVRYMDGAFSDNLPLLDEHTVTVSPFCGESDICPRDRSPHILQLNLNWANTCIRLSRRNLRRMVRIVLPGRTDFMASFCQQGYDDALYFLRKNNLLKDDTGSQVTQERELMNWMRQQDEPEDALQDNQEVLEDQRTLEYPEEQEQKDLKDGKCVEKEKLLQKDGDKQKYSELELEKENLHQALEPTRQNRRLDDGYSLSLLTRPWYLLRQLVVAPPRLSRIVRSLSHRLTLYDQPHFDLAMMQAPTSHAPALPRRPPLTDSDSSSGDK
ncbi:hypothetical protein KR026_005245, partial [Drosophila bipectinata]